MDFLNRALAQVRDLFLSMTPGARITAGLLLATVVISLAYLFHSGIGGSDAYLFSGESFTSSEQHAMEAAFAKAGLNAYAFEGGRVRVPRGQQNVYVAALATGKALPLNFGELLQTVVNDTNVFRPRDTVNTAIETAREMTLSNIISKMNGIDDNATVMFGSREEPGLLHKKTRTASVTVKPRGNETLSAELADSIRSMVASAEAIERSNITVTDRNTGRTYQCGPDEASGAGKRLRQGQAGTGTPIPAEDLRGPGLRPRRDRGLRRCPGSRPTPRRDGGQVRSQAGPLRSDR